MRKGVLAFVLLLIQFTAATTYSASFDCKKADTEIEKMICADAELSRLDEELASTYKSAIKGANLRKDKDVVRAAQKAWLKRRDACKDAACLKVRYEERQTVLSAIRPEGKQKAFRVITNDSQFPERVRACIDFADNLNQFPAWPPMACERKLSPKFPQLRRPSWRFWDQNEIWQRRALLKSVAEKFVLVSPVTGKPVTDTEWDAHIGRLLKEQKIKVKEATDVPLGSRYERWLTYEIGNPAENNDPYTQLENCTQSRKYAKLVVPDGTRLSDEPGSTLLGYRDFLIYRDESVGEIRVMEGWNVEPGFKDAELLVDQECVIEYAARPNQR